MKPIVKVVQKAVDQLSNSARNGWMLILCQFDHCAVVNLQGIERAHVHTTELRRSFVFQNSDCTTSQKGVINGYHEKWLMHCHQCGQREVFGSDTDKDDDSDSESD